MSHHANTLQVVFASIHDAVLFAVRNGQTESYLSSDVTLEVEETSRIAFDASLQLRGVRSGARSVPDV
jgi:hypothetical protein